MATFLRQRSTFQIVGQSTPSLITTYWDSAGGTGVALATEATARVRAFFNTLAATLANGCIWTPNLVVDEVEETTGDLVNQYGATAPAAVSFTGSGDALPFYTQALLRFGTASFINGRRLQGRMFVPGWTEVANQGNPPTLSGAAATALTNAANALGTTIVTPMSQRVWHRPSPSAAGLSVPVITRQIAPGWAVMKSRRS